MSDLIDRQAATNALWAERERLDMFMKQCLETGQMDSRSYAKAERNQVEKDIYIINDLPAAQPEIIRCKDCKYWIQTTGKRKGYGLGRCDFHDADLVSCNGFCYWVERRTDG